MNNTIDIKYVESLHDDSIYKWNQDQYPYILSDDINKFFNNKIPEYIKNISKPYIFRGMGMYYEGAVCKEDIDYVDDYAKSQGYEEISENEYKSLKNIYELFPKNKFWGYYKITKSMKGIKAYFNREDAETDNLLSGNNNILIRQSFPFVNSEFRIYKKNIDNKIDFRIFDDISYECTRTEVPTRKNKKYWQRLSRLTDKQIHNIKNN